MPKRAQLDFKLRLFRIDQLIHDRGVVSFEEMEKELRCSAPTIKRDLRYMRERLNAPVAFSRKKGGYYYLSEPKPGQKASSRQEVPPVWYTPREMFMLLVTIGLFSEVEAEGRGLLSGEMSALKARLLSLVQDNKLQARELQKRFKAVLPQHQPCSCPFFQIIGGALAARKRIRITYFTRSRQSETDREVSPMRLVWYRGRWYLDAWCHSTETLKTFSLDNIIRAEVSPKNCRAVAMRDVQQQLDSTYGIFSGSVKLEAVIEVDSEMGAFVRDEIWHSEQKMEIRGDGSLRLSVPYASATELTGQILRLGRHARVVSPESLKSSIREELANMLSLYPDEEPVAGVADGTEAGS